MKTWYPPSWQDCAVCRTPTQDALCGNRLLSRWEVRSVPTELAPTLSWRCERHQGFQMRPPSFARANTLGDLIFTLRCGHEVYWIIRDRQDFTPARVAAGLATGQLQLGPPQRCYRCGDLERENKATHEP